MNHEVASLTKRPAAALDATDKGSLACVSAPVLGKGAAPSKRLAAAIKVTHKTMLAHVLAYDPRTAADGRVLSRACMPPREIPNFERTRGWA